MVLLTEKSYTMKRSHLFLFVFVLVCNISFFAQESKQVKNTPPSDAPSGFTYDFDKTQNLIVDRLSNPNEFNKDVQILISASDFPVLKTGETINSAYREKIRIWMEKNPTLIINTLKHRNDIVKPY